MLVIAEELAALEAGVAVIPIEGVVLSGASELAAFLSSEAKVVVFLRLGSRTVDGASVISSSTIPPSRLVFIELEPEPREAILERRFKEPEGVEVDPSDDRRDRPGLVYPEL